MVLNIFAMSSKQTQIALDFGQESQSPPVPPPTGNGAGEDLARPYLAAAGVGIRVKSLKQPSAAPPAPPEEMPSRPTVKIVNGDLFGITTPEMPADIAETLPEQSTPPEPEIAQVAKIPVEEPGPPEPAPAIEATLPIPLIEATSPEILPEPSPEPPVEATSPEPQSNIEDPLPRRRTSPGKTTMSKQGPSKRGRKSLKQVSAEADLIEIPTDEVLFSKQYYTMGEVSEMFRVNQSLLRFWETEFDLLQPKKNKKGDRYFRPVDIKNLHLIYHLLRQKKYTIEGAKDFLKKNKKADERFEVIQRLQQIKAFLVEWKAQL